MSSRSLAPSSAEIASAATDWVTRQDAGLTAAEEQALTVWQAADARHAAAFEAAAATWAVFDRAQRQGAVDAILAGLAARARRRRQRRLQGAAAAALVLCAGLFFIRASDPTPAPEGTVAQQPPAGESPPAVNLSIRKLPDGSMVELKTGAEISVHYEPAARRVTLVKGEAYFRVAKDAARPFYVEANGIVVRAVGTAFSVQMKPSAVEIFVKEGAVDVGRTPAPVAHAAAPGPGSDSPVVRVNAGKRFVALIKLIPASRPPGPARAEPAAEPQPVTEDEMNHQLAWRDTRQELNGLTLTEAVAWLNRQNFTQILIEDPAVGQLRVSGSFRSDNPEGFVHLVERSFDLRAEARGEHVIVLRRQP